MSDKYLSLAFDELLREDALCVMARGCGIHRLLCKFIEWFALQEDFSTHRKSMFILNCQNEDYAHKDAADRILHTLKNFGIKDSHLPKFVHSNWTSATRNKSYKAGGCFIVSTRMFIADTINKNVDFSEVVGFLVPDAHEIDHQSLEAIILEAFRNINRKGFIKAFTDQPEALLGYGKVERLLKKLWVKHLHLWPRFKKDVINALDSVQPEVIELSQKLNVQIMNVQKTILTALNITIMELKKLCPELDNENMRVQDGISESFYPRVKEQLNPQWFRLGPNVRTLVEDLRDLRLLLFHLVSMSAIDFYTHLMRYIKDKKGAGKTGAGNMRQNYQNYHIWMESTVCLDAMISHARERVFSITAISLDGSKGGKSKAAEADREKRRQAANAAFKNQYFFSEETFKRVRVALKLGKTITPTCEIPSKWRLMKEVMEEIKTAYQSRIHRQQASLNEGENLCDFLDMQQNCNRVLVLVKDKVTIRSLVKVMRVGVDREVDAKYRFFILKEAARVRNYLTDVFKAVPNIKGATDSVQQQQSKGGKSKASKNARIQPRQLNDRSTGIGTMRKNRNFDPQKFEKESTIDHLLNVSLKGALRLSEQDRMFLYEELLLSHSCERNVDPVEDVVIENDFSDYLMDEDSNTGMPGQYKYNQYGGNKRKASRAKESNNKGKKTRKQVKAALGIVGVDDEEEEAEEGPSKNSNNDEYEMDNESSSFDKIYRLDSSQESQASATDQNEFPSLEANNEEGGGCAESGNIYAMDEEDMGASTFVKDSLVATGSFQDPTLRVMFMCHEELNNHPAILLQTQPFAVVMYEPDLRIVRMLEVYEAEQQQMRADMNAVREMIRQKQTSTAQESEGKSGNRNDSEKESSVKEKLKVFFLMYDGSAEEHKYVTSLSRERRAFEHLIKTKEKLAICLPDLTADMEAVRQENFQISTDTRTVKRTALGSKNEKKIILVDSRELRDRNALIAELWRLPKIILVSRTIHVGDYHLAPNICIERKALGDLTSSLTNKDGRLIRQCEQMLKYYSNPIVLIEFHKDQMFGLKEDKNAYNSSIDNDSTQARLSILVSKFPAIRVMWSRSASATASLFARLMLGKEGLDLDATMARVGSSIESTGTDTNPLGTSSGSTDNDGDGAIAEIMKRRETSINMLLALPGVNEQNYRNIINRVENLVELATYEEGELAPLVGPMNARELYMFFNNAIPDL